MSLDFDGTGDWLTRANFFRATTEQFTAMGWVYFDALPTPAGHYMNLFGMQGTCMAGVLNNGGTQVFIIGHASADVLGKTAPVTGRWYHVAFLRYNSVRKLWINGYLEANTTNAEGGNTGFIIADFNAVDDGDEMDGRIAAVKVWTGSQCMLSDDQIRREMRQTWPARWPAIRGVYPLGTTTSITDLSGWGQTLTVAGNPTAAVGPPIVWSAKNARRAFDVPAAVSGTFLPAWAVGASQLVGWGGHAS